MKLYFRPAACSLAPHIVARELRLELELVEVERGTGRTTNGDDFLAINPKAYVPALVLDDGEILIEGAAILLHLANLRPTAGLGPKDAFQRRQFLSLLNFIATELHKPMSQMFDPNLAAVHDHLRRQVADRLDWMSGELRAAFLTGATFCVADAYLFTVLNWSQWLGIDLQRWPRLRAFMQRVGARSAVREAIAAEGLVLHPDGASFAPAA